VRLIPVLDLRAGRVVRGAAGRRAEYRPLESPLGPAADPAAVADALVQRAGAAELYVADLDAVAGAPPALSVYGSLRRPGRTLWVDAGLRHAEDAAPLAGAGVDGIVAGLETLRGPRALAHLLRRHGPERVVFSLDLADGRPLVGGAGWCGADALLIAAEAIGMGVRRLIVLDLRRVGGGEGTGTEDLCRLLTPLPGLEVIAGGGVRDAADVRRLADLGVAGVLVSSALHEGRLP
jgi:phosphoribosylformimino-5-aminoimidazole carboxamide ribotide isomerase